MLDRMRADWPAYLDEFFTVCFSEPHSTKPYEDAVLDGWAAEGRMWRWGWQAGSGNDMRGQARAVRCPTLVIHGDDDGRVPYSQGEIRRG